MTGVDKHALIQWQRASWYHKSSFHRDSEGKSGMTTCCLRHAAMAQGPDSSVKGIDSTEAINDCDRLSPPAPRKDAWPGSPRLGGEKTPRLVDSTSLQSSKRIRSSGKCPASISKSRFFPSSSSSARLRSSMSVFS